MIKRRGICPKCNKEKQIHTKDGWCNVCYKRFRWKPKLVKCKRCERMLPMHAKGLCRGCYSSTFHTDKVKLHNAKRLYNIGPELYQKITEKCVICGFDNIIDIHHLDHNHKNSSETNLIGLCPNHHKMIHHKQYQKGIFQILQEKGFKLPKEGFYKTDGFLGKKRRKWDFLKFV